MMQSYRNQIEIERQWAAIAEDALESAEAENARLRAELAKAEAALAAATSPVPADAIEIIRDEKESFEPTLPELRSRLRQLETQRLRVLPTYQRIRRDFGEVDALVGSLTRQILDLQRKIHKMEGGSAKVVKPAIPRQRKVAKPKPKPAKLTQEIEHKLLAFSIIVAGQPRAKALEVAKGMGIPREFALRELNS